MNLAWDELAIHTELHSPETLQPTATGRKRNLGGAVLLAAIGDYRGMDQSAHLDAARFLFPKTAEDRTDFCWVVAMADGIDGTWLREALDRARERWDRERVRKRTERRYGVAGRCIQ